MHSPLMNMTAETHSAKCTHRCYWFLEGSGTLSDRVYTKASTRRVCLNIYHLKSNGFSLNIDSGAIPFHLVLPYSGKPLFQRLSYSCVAIHRNYPNHCLKSWERIFHGYAYRWFAMDNQRNGSNEETGNVFHFAPKTRIPDRRSAERL